ncbi:MAG: sigma-70 family RNA polymerase sigma factor [Candidatus Paceibacterota bacterium]
MNRLKKEEEYLLIAKAKDGDSEALEILFKSQENWITKKMSEFRKKYPFLKLSFSDLMRAGQIAVWEAIKGFDFSKDCRLVTYLDFKILRQIEEILRFELEPKSQKLVFENDDSYFSFFSDLVSNIPSPRDSLSSREMRKKKSVFLKKALSLLTERQKEVIRLRFLEIDRKPRTLKEVARLLKITPEAVRQSFKRAVRTIQKSFLLRGDEFDFF